MPSSYVEVEVNADPELVEHLVGILSQVGFEGFWEEGPLLKCYIRSARWSTALFEEVSTTIGRINRPGIAVAPRIVVRNIEDRNWNEEWEKTIQPIHVTDRIVIRPTWHTYIPADGEIVVTIDPKMSFGTGYHETTRLVLRMMEKYLRPGSRLLDIGTGTGVLAITGMKLGGISAVGVDVDEWSFTNAMENIGLNDMERNVRIIHGDLSAVPAGVFDMIVANIQLNVLEPLLVEMRERLADAGMLILSGLLLQDREQIMTALSRSGLIPCEEMTENEWLALAASGESGERP